MIFDKNSGKMLLIAGPCSLENMDLSLEVAEKVSDIARRHARELVAVFKGSFDKANRTSSDSPRGPGMKEGMRIFEAVKEKFGLKVISDVHESWQCAELSEVCDVLQIPAYLCRQTDLLTAAAKTGRAVNVKKGQFLAPEDMKFVVSKLRGAGCSEIWQTERGTTFGYNNLVVDMRSFAIMACNGAPTIMDATHATQHPGGSSGVSGGDSKFASVLAGAAIAAGADGIFIETHPDPSKAISDAASQVPLRDLDKMVEKCLRLKGL